MIHPDDTFEFRFEHEQDVPAETQRVFIYRHQTAGHWMRFERRRNEIRRLPREEQNRAVMEFCTSGLVGWRNCAIEFDAGKLAADPLHLADVLTPAELNMLALGLPASASLDDHQKKASLLRSLSASGNSAADAGASADDRPTSGGPPASAASPAAAVGAGAAAAAATGS